MNGVVIFSRVYVPTLPDHTHIRYATAFKWRNHQNNKKSDKKNRGKNSFHFFFQFMRIPWG